MNKNKNIRLIFYIFFLLCLFFILAPLLAPHDPMRTHATMTCEPPSGQHLFGTDELGRDILSRMLFGGRTTLLIGLIATSLSCFIGTALGLISGYYGGKTDILISQVMNLALAFPSLLLAIGISVVLPAGFLSVVIALSIAGWADFGRLIRGQTLTLKNREFITAATVLGSSSGKIIVRHILPNCIPLLIVSFSMKLGTFMLAESGLSFLGLGIPPPYPTLGGMISSGRDMLITCPWIPLLPGFLISIMVLVFNLLGEMLQSVSDPKRKKS
ncbi:MAG: ABC transporter permease [Candidatus Aureabacteria bacterium]|nr:ABC transporter permease [Candidatus Auribacterota bacterium]